MSSVSINCVVESHSLLGEGAVWDAPSQLLWWVDIAAGLIHAFEPASGENRTWDWGEPVGCLAVRQSGGLLLATKTGFHFFDPTTGEREALVDPEANLPNHRFNDGTTDTRGRFWAGTMKEGGDPEQAGRFYRFTADQQVTPFFDKVYTTNGLAFSPEGTTLYFSDSNAAVRTIWSCTYDPESGTPGKPTVFFDTRQVKGRPDGGTVDADGCYWMAGITGGQIVRITPAGRIDRIIDVPVEKPTKPMFGGSRLDTLYVTSLGGDGKGMGGKSGSNDGRTLDGCLFAVTGLGVSGVSQARFAG